MNNDVEIEIVDDGTENPKAVIGICRTRVADTGAFPHPDNDLGRVIGVNTVDEGDLRDELDKLDIDYDDLEEEVKGMGATIGAIEIKEL